MLEFILNLLYPKTCGICKKICKQYICPKCKYNIKKYEIANIKKFKDKHFEEMAYIFKYEGIIRERIIEYKFFEAGYIYKTFSEIIIKNKKISDFIKKYDIIIPVPVHKNRKKQRGYNQTELIAKEIGTKLKIDTQINVLIKMQNTKPQSMLDKENRKKNVKNAYKTQNESKIYGKNVLLLDDIYTTGSTANECSRMLKFAGANKIGVLTIAKD